jgi:glycosyltransferase involved in cell wall biosynthesis
MKVLFQNWRDVFAQWGGDTTQLTETKNALERLGVEVDISAEQQPDLAGYDVVHIFNIQRADCSLAQVLNAKSRNVPVAVSTIYWDMRHILSSDEYFRYVEDPRAKLLGKICGCLPRLYINARTYPMRRLIDSSARRMLAEADMLLPNSYSEMEILALLFRMPEVRAKSMIVPNAVRADVNDSDPRIDGFADLPQKYVLEAGTYYPVKGQLKLIEALMEDREIPLVFVGNDLEGSYGRACRRLGELRGNTFFFPHVPHDEIGGFYRRAKVHALPSLRESPGLSTLEASIRGANCVVSFHGPILEYFGTDAWVCDPEDARSIRKAVIAAWNAEPNTRLAERIRTKFTWENAASVTLDAYNRMLENRQGLIE